MIMFVIPLLIILTVLIASGLRACDTNQSFATSASIANANYIKPLETKKIAKEKIKTVIVPKTAFLDHIMRDYHADMQKRLYFQETKNAFLSWLSKTNPDEEIFNQFIAEGCLILCEKDEADITTAYVTEDKEEVLQFDLFEDKSEIAKKVIDRKYYKYIGISLDG